MDDVHKPPHYTLPGHLGVECIDVIQALKLDLLIGSAFQYLWRAGRADGLAKGDDAKHLNDLKKAKWYIERKIHNLTQAVFVPNDVIPEKLGAMFLDCASEECIDRAAGAHVHYVHLRG